MTILLHGFWGQPQDWNPVINKIALGKEVLIPDLYEEGPLGPQHALDVWAKNFHSWLAHECGDRPVDLVGYSMGARLALNALVANQGRFRRALLLSGAAHIPQADVQARAVWEELWRERFAEQPWGELEALWQEQSVFGAEAKVARRRGDRMREALGLSLTNWSVTKHPFTLEHVKRLPETVEWAFGALDQKYLGMAKTLQDLPVRGQITIIPNAGHRLITGATDFVARWIDKE